MFIVYTFMRTARALLAISVGLSCAGIVHFSRPDPRKRMFYQLRSWSFGLKGLVTDDWINKIL